MCHRGNNPNIIISRVVKPFSFVDGPGLHDALARMYKESDAFYYQEVDV